jgi:hypothetical protein
MSVAGVLGFPVTNSDRGKLLTASFFINLGAEPCLRPLRSSMQAFSMTA